MDSPGLALQMIGLGRIVQAAGHEVGYVANPRMAQLCDGFGARLLGGVRDAFTLRDWASVESTRLQTAELADATEAFSPDVLVATPFGYGPAICSELARVPLAIIGGVTFPWSGSWRHADGLRSYDAGRIALGLMPLGERGLHGHPPWLGNLVLLQSVPTLAGSPREGDRLAYVGDCSWDPAVKRDPALETWLGEAEAAGRDIVYAQIGREFGVAPMDDYLETIAAERALSIVIDTARSDRKRASTGSSVYTRPFIPRHAVLPRCRLAIGSGHPTTVLGALAQRIPLVLLANGSGTEEAAAACERAGVACAGALAGTSLESLRGLVNDALDSDRHAALDRIASELAQAGGPDRAASLVVELAHSRRVAAVA